MYIYNIEYNHEVLPVEKMSEDHFAVYGHDGVLFLVCKEDNEGASHWFEEGKDNETQLTSELGVLIEHSDLCDSFDHEA
ncbi:MAG TPA: hypothetical protein VM802_07225 [Chitinophaga sp.]|uniref:hypothetical protein n=1 Tax=Chitinophaga sp. TaxID=1869181 RepID=UPI002C57B6B8|nr:hypothetical protein [Chitinophaga sp.]HVI44642.1 hypothetical protein [Chitinophaga sp.]